MKPFRGRTSAALVFLTLIAAALSAAPSSAARIRPSALHPKRLPPPTVDKQAGKPEFDRHSLLIRFKPGTSEQDQDQSLQEHGLSRIGEIAQIRFVVAKIDSSSRSAKSARDSMRSDSRVEIAQLNYLRHADATPNDPLYVDSTQKYLRNIKMESAWDITKGSTSYAIAILDTGVDLDTPDLVGSRLKPGYDFVNNDATPDDDNGHGTMVAGIAGAHTNNGLGLAGAAWSAGIMPVKVLDSTGSGTDANVSSGITWAADHGAKIINMSLGGYATSTALEDAVNYAVGKGVVVVSSAGNDAVSFPSYPAAYSNVIAVSATGVGGGQFAWFSNYGWWVDVSAPGMSIVGPYPVAGPAESYAIGDGTSFASPIVAGIADLVRYKNPSWTPAQVMTQIEKTARDWGPAGIDPYYGWGWVDGNAALGGTKQSPGTPPARDSSEPNDTLDRATSLSSSLSRSISPEGDVDWYVTSVASTSTKSITFSVTPPSFSGTRPQEFDPVLDVFGPDLKELGFMDQGFAGDAETVTVPVSATGNYYIMARSYGGSQSPGNYSVAAQQSTALPPIMLGTPQGYVVGAYPYGLQIGDVTGDGLNDAVIGTGYYTSPDSFKLFVYPQLSSGTLDTPTKYPIDSSNYQDPANVAIGDLDGDGQNDVAVGAAKGVDLFYQRNGALIGPTLISTVPGQVQVADMDGDGRNDIVLSGSGTTIIFRNSSSGFAPTTVASETLYYLNVADVTSDGKLDLIGVGSSSIIVYALNGGSTYQKSSYPFTETPHWMDVGDVTGDGRPDAVLSTGYQTVTVLPGAATGGFGPEVKYTVQPYPDLLTVADLNGDGRKDVVVNHYYEFGILLQGPAGTLESEALYQRPASFGVNQLAAGDLTGDGLADVVVVADTDPQQVETMFIYPQLRPSHELIGVRKTFPADFSTGISRTVSPSITFGRALDPASISSATVYLKNGTSFNTVAATVSYDPATQKIKLTSTGTRTANHPYIVFVDGVKDTNGNVMPLYTFRFTTGA